MAVEADKVVVELLAQTSQFDAATKQSASDFTKNMGDVAKASTAGSGAVGQFSSALKENRLGMNQSRIGMMEFQHVARGVSDQFASSGLSTQLFTSHIGELSEAVVLSGGAFGKLGAFLQGPWGIAFTLATSVVGGLIGAHLNAKDAAQKHQTAEETLASFVNGEAVAADALTESLKKLNDERSKALESTNEQIRAEANLALATLHTAEANRAVLAAQLAQARADETSHQVGIGQQGGIGSESSLAAARAADIQQQISALDKAIGGATALISSDLTTLARNLSTNVGRVKDAFDREQAELEAKYQGTKTKRGNQTVLSGGLLNAPGLDTAGRQRLLDQLAGQEEKLNATRAKAVSAAEKLDQAEDGQAKSADKAAKSTGEFGKQIGFAEATSIAKGAGLTVTSGYRSEAKQAELYRTVRTAENPVAKPGTSAHEGTNGKWALDIAFAPGLTAQSLKKLYGDQGVSLTAVYKETGHYHIEGSRSQAAAADKAATDAAQKSKAQSATFQTELDGLNEQIIAARKSQVKDALDQVTIEEDSVKAEQKKRDDAYLNAAANGRITQAQASLLIATSATLAAEKLRTLETQKQVVLIQRQDTAAERDAQYKEDNLKAAEQAATSQAQRRELDLAILDILYDEKAAHLERLKLIAEGNKDYQTANDLQGQIDQLPQQKENDTAATLRQTMDPLESWLKSVPHDAQAVTEALQGIAVNGFDNIASSIAGVVTGTQSLGSAFKNLAQQVVGDLVQMTVRMLIFRALSSAIGGLGGGGGANVTLGSSPLSSPDMGSLFSQVDAINIPTLAGGGAGIIGGAGGIDNNLLALNGKPIAWVSQGEGLTITPSNATAAPAFSGAAQGMVLVQVEANDYFDARVAQVSGPIAAQAGTRAAYGGAALARNNLARRQLHQLGSRG